MKYLNLNQVSVSPPAFPSWPSLYLFGNKVLPFEKWSSKYSTMKALSAIMTGSDAPGAVTAITGDFPRAWTFLSSGGAMELLAHESSKDSGARTPKT